MNAISEDSYDFNRGLFTDGRDGHAYKTIKIGSQQWMAENLDFDAGEGCFYYFKGWTAIGHKEVYVKEYGRLYNREVAIKSCPKGWHIPSKNDFEILLANFNDEIEAYKSLINNGSSGFDVHLAGWKNECFRLSQYGYGEINLNTKFWSIDKQVRQYRDDLYFYLYIQGQNSRGKVHAYIDDTEYTDLKSLAMSVRCIKD